MSALYRCDQCKREVRSEEAMVGWLVLSERTPPKDSEPGPFNFGPRWPKDVVGDFCSWTCVAEHAAERRLLADGGVQ